MQNSAPARLVADAGFNVARHDDAYALGLPNGQGGVKAYALGRQRAVQLVERLSSSGLAAHLRPGDEQDKHYVMFFVSEEAQRGPK